jgi:hypothetical protein
MYAVTQVLRSDFPRSWQEAVALIQEIALALGDLSTVPAPEDLFLDEDGNIQIGFASEADEHPVTSLANMLLAALEGVEAPPQLRSLAVDNAKTPPAHTTVAGFTRALAFYERPDRRSDMRAIVTRLSAQRLPPDTEEELERLRERLAPPRPEREPEEQAEQPTPVQTSRTTVDIAAIMASIVDRLPNRQVMLAAAIVIAVVGALAVAALALARTFGGATEVSTAASASTPADSAASPAPSSTSTSTATGARSVTPPPSAAGKPSNNTRTAGTTIVQKTTGSVPVSQAHRTPAAPVSRAAMRPSVAGTTTDHPLPIAPLSGIRSPEGDGTSAGELSAEAVMGHVYSAAEPDVIPARLTRSQLPHEPSPNDETGYFDIIVDERGEVEFVKLLSPTRRYQDRMLVAAAKAWKFSPALLNGTPVKYRLQIPIILHDVAR